VSVRAPGTRSQRHPLAVGLTRIGWHDGRVPATARLALVVLLALGVGALPAFGELHVSGQGDLGTGGIGTVHFGLPQSQAVAKLTALWEPRAQAVSIPDVARVTPSLSGTISLPNSAWASSPDTGTSRAGIGSRHRDLPLNFPSEVSDCRPCYPEGNLDW